MPKKFNAILKIRTYFESIFDSEETPYSPLLTKWFKDSKMKKTTKCDI